MTNKTIFRNKCGPVDGGDDGVAVCDIKAEGVVREHEVVPLPSEHVHCVVLR